MANRVVLDANGLRVSKPGFNAVTTGAANLVFNSDWSAMGVYTTGEFTFNWPSLPLNEDTMSISQNVNIGTTFSSPPIVTFEGLINSVWTTMPGNGRAAFEFTRTIDISGTPRTAWYTISALVTTSQIQFRGNADVGGVLNQARFFPPNLTVRYTVFTYNF